MGLTPTPCGHSREYPAQTKRRNFPGKIKRAVHRPARSLVGCPLLLCAILYRFIGLVLFFQPSEDVFQIACRLCVSGFYRINVNIKSCSDLAVSQSVRHFWNGSVPSYQQRGAGVPLRYNYDKPEKPRRIKGFEVFSLVFSSFSKPKNHTEISRIIGGVSLTTNE